MGILRQREERRKTFLRARMRTEHGWSDVTIGNVSSRGLLLQGPPSLRRNSFIEVRHRNVCIVGRIVWTHGPKCGVRTQDPIDVSGLLSHAPQKRIQPGERRVAPRRAQGRSRRSPAEAAEANRRLARTFEWVVMVVTACAAGVFVAQAAWTVLGTPLARAASALYGP